MFLWEVLVVVLLIMLNGFLAMSELAIVSARRARLQHMADDGHRGARAALRLAEDSGRFLSTVQIGLSLIGVLAGAYGGATLATFVAGWLRQVPVLAAYADSMSIALVVIVITYLSLIIGELVPKRLALAHAEAIAAVVGPPMLALSRAIGPLAWFLGASSNLVLRLTGLSSEKSSTVTEEEVKSLIAEGTEMGVFAPGEQQLIEGVLRLADRTVRGIMTPRHDMSWLDIEDPADTIRREIAEAGHSRLPVCRGTLDEVVGIVHTKDLLDRVLEGKPFDLQAAVQKPLIVHDGTQVLRLLELFRQSGLHIAVVVDEYGSVEGLVTVTDILETIAGELPEEGEGDEPGILRREDGSWLVDGMLAIDEVEAKLGLKGLRGPDDDFHTLAGFVLNRLGRVPQATDHFVWENLRFEVVDMDGRRVDKVLIAPAAPRSDTD